MIFLIFGVALISYLPSLFFKTNYDFVYATCTNSDIHYRYGCKNYIQNKYKVEDNHISIKDVNTKIDYDKDGIVDEKIEYVVRFFLHDTLSNTSREITLEELKTIKLNGLITSPDGVTISRSYNRNADIFFIYNNASYNLYLTKGNKKQKLNLISMDNRYYYEVDNFSFIGWVLPGRTN